MLIQRQRGRRTVSATAPFDQRASITSISGGVGDLVASNILWTDNTNGTATVTFTVQSPCYAGVDYGTSAGVYTKSSFNYDGAGPALESNTSHTVEIPDPIAGGTETATTYYYRIWMSPGSYSAEYTGVITDAAGIGLEGSTDVILMESGDIVLVESGSETDISAFTAASTLGGTEDILGVQGGNSRRITPTQIKTYVNT